MLLRKEKRFKKLLADHSIALHALVIAELTDVLIRRAGIEPARVQATIEQFIEASDSALIVLEPELARRAGELRARYYSKSKRPLSMTDCALVITASERNLKLVTSDLHLVEVAAAEDVTIKSLS